MSGDVDMRNLVEELRRFAAMPSDAARIAAPLVEEEAKKFAKAGVDPATGEAWAPLKRGGKRALANAADALKAKALGAVIQLSLAFPYLLHDRGDGHAPRRRILPRAISGPFQKVLVAACRLAFDRLVKK